jgi:outer membrane immunogenic protein
MRKTTVGIAALAVLIGTPVLAADMSVKAPPPPVAAPAYDWTGFYLGGTIGYSVAHNPSAPVFPAFGGPFDQVTLAPSGFLGGFEGGYNWQIKQWVFGFEADWQWTGEKDSFCLDCVPLGRGFAQRLPWFATVRGRLGYAVGPALFYATGGAAFGDVATTPACCTTQFGPTFTDHKTGWVAGGGVEGALAGNWTAKIEYLYLQLGSTSDSFVLPAFAPATMVANSSIHDHIFRVGLNYRFGGTPYAPVAAAPSPSMPVKAPVMAIAAAYNWTGFYVGGNVGYSAARDKMVQTFPGFNFDRFTFAPIGWTGGGQFGANVQTGSVVFGVEGDWQWSGERDFGLCRDCPVTPGFNNQNIAQKLPWFATVRGRVGYAAGPVLFYATGGAAFTRLHTDFADTALPLSLSASFDSNKTGAALGGGIEAALGGNWTAKVEYLYMNFGTVSVTVPSNPVVGPVFLSSQVRDSVARAGLNYRFTSGPL